MRIIEIKIISSSLTGLLTWVTVTDVICLLPIGDHTSAVNFLAQCLVMWATSTARRRK